MKISEYYEDAKVSCREAFERAASPLEWAFTRTLECTENYIPASKRQLGKIDARLWYRIALFINGSSDVLATIAQFRGDPPEKIQEQQKLRKEKQGAINAEMISKVEQSLEKAGYDPKKDDGYIRVLKLKGGRQEFDLSLQ